VFDHSQDRCRFVVRYTVENALRVLGRAYRRGHRVSRDLVELQSGLMLFHDEQVFQPPVRFHLKRDARRVNKNKQRPTVTVVCAENTARAQMSAYRVRPEILEVPGETLGQPQVIPPGTRHQVAEPLTALLLFDDHRRLFFEFRFRIVIKQHVPLPGKKTNVK